VFLYFLRCYKYFFKSGDSVPFIRSFFLLPVLTFFPAVGFSFDDTCPAANSDGGYGYCFNTNHRSISGDLEIKFNSGEIDVDHIDLEAIDSARCDNNSDLKIDDQNGDFTKVTIPHFDGDSDNLLCDKDTNYPGSNFKASDGKYELKIYKKDSTTPDDTITIIVDHLKPNPPSVLNPDSCDGCLDISWTASSDYSYTREDDTDGEGSGIHKYIIKVYSDYGTASQLEVENVDTTETSLKVDDLENGKTYRVEVYAVDCAGNVSDVKFKNGTPLEVRGFMNETAGCFIATATFGDYDHPIVKVFREFRDKILLKSDFGHYLVSLYYEYSPSIANIIASNLFLRLVSFILLGVLAVMAGVILLNPGAILILVSSLSIMLIFKFLSGRYFRGYLYGIVFAIVLYPTEILSSAPKDEDFISPSIKIMIEGDFGGCLEGRESVLRKYRNEKFKELQSELKQGTKKPSKCYELVAGPYNPSEKFDQTARDRYNGVYSDKGGYIVYMSIDHNIFRGVAGILSIRILQGRWAGSKK